MSDEASDLARSGTLSISRGGRGGPFAAEADAEQELDGDQRGVAPGEAREAGEGGEPEDAGHEGELAAVAVREPSPADVAEDAADALGGDDQAHGGEADAEMPADLRQEQQQDHLCRRRRGTSRGSRRRRGASAGGGGPSLPSPAPWGAAAENQGAAECGTIAPTASARRLSALRRRAISTRSRAAGEAWDPRRPSCGRRRVPYRDPWRRTRSGDKLRPPDPHGACESQAVSAGSDEGRDDIIEHLLPTAAFDVPLMLLFGATLAPARRSGVLQPAAAAVRGRGGRRVRRRRQRPRRRLVRRLRHAHHARHREPRRRLQDRPRQAARHAARPVRPRDDRRLPGAAGRSRTRRAPGEGTRPRPRRGHARRDLRGARPPDARRACHDRTARTDRARDGTAS